MVVPLLPTRLFELVEAFSLDALNRQLQNRNIILLLFPWDALARGIIGYFELLQLYTSDIRLPNIIRLLYPNLGCRNIREYFMFFYKTE